MAPTSTVAVTPNIVFFHQNNHCDVFGNHYPVRERTRQEDCSFSCAVDLDEISMLLAWPEQLIQAIKSGKELVINLGVTICHPKDCFCFATGREQAKANISPRQLRAIQYEVCGGDDGTHWMTSVVFDVVGTNIQMIVESDAKRQMPKVSFRFSRY